MCSGAAFVGSASPAPRCGQESSWRPGSRSLLPCDVELHGCQSQLVGNGLCGDLSGLGGDLGEVEPCEKRDQGQATDECEGQQVQAFRNAECSEEVHRDSV